MSVINHFAALTKSASTLDTARTLAGDNPLLQAAIDAKVQAARDNIADHLPPMLGVGALGGGTLGSVLGAIGGGVSADGSGVGRGAVRGAGAGVGAGTGAALGVGLAGMHDPTSVPLAILGGLGGAGLGGALGYKGTKALTKTEEEAKREKKANVTSHFTNLAKAASTLNTQDVLRDIARTTSAKSDEAYAVGLNDVLKASKPDGRKVNDTIQDLSSSLVFNKENHPIRIGDKHTNLLTGLATKLNGGAVESSGDDYGTTVYGMPHSKLDMKKLYSSNNDEEVMTELRKQVAKNPATNLLADNKPGTSILASLAPYLAVGAPAIGAGIGAIGGGGKGALRGTGAGVGALGGGAAGTYLADLLNNSDAMKNTSGTTKALVSGLGALSGAGLGGFAGYKGTKALTKDKKEQETK